MEKASALILASRSFQVLGMVRLRFSARPRRRVSLPLRCVQDVEGQETGGVKPDVDHHRTVTSCSALQRGCPTLLPATGDMNCTAVPNGSLPSTSEDENT